MSNLPLLFFVVVRHFTACGLGVFVSHFFNSYEQLVVALFFRVLTLKEHVPRASVSRRMLLLLLMLLPSPPHRHVDIDTFMAPNDSRQLIGRLTKLARSGLWKASFKVLRVEQALNTRKAAAAREKGEVTLKQEMRLCYLMPAERGGPQCDGRDL